MIAGLAQHDLRREALYMFSQMEKSGTKPNKITFIASFLLVAVLAWLIWSFNFLKNMKLRYGIDSNEPRWSTMVG